MGRKLSYGPVWDDDLRRIDLPDGSWVDVKRYITKADYAAAQNAGAGTVRGLKQGEQLEAAFSAGTFQLVILQRVVKAWSFTRNGRPVPCTAEIIGRLPEHTCDLIMEGIDAANIDTEEGQENLALSTETSSTAVEPAPES